MAHETIIFYLLQDGCTCMTKRLRRAFRKSFVGVRGTLNFALRAQSAQIWSTYGFSIRNRNDGCGVGYLDP